MKFVDFIKIYCQSYIIYSKKMKYISCFKACIFHFFIYTQANRRLKETPDNSKIKIIFIFELSGVFRD